MSGADEPWVRLRSRPRGPRVFRNLVEDEAPGLRAGDRVAVLDREGELFGWGLYHPRSAIPVRILRRGAEPFTRDWLCEQAVAAARRRLEDPEIAGTGDAWRVIHAESDDFPGLTVDRLGAVLSAEAFTVNALELFDTVAPALHEALGTEHSVVRFDERPAHAEGEQPVFRSSEGCPGSVKVGEHGLRYEVQFARGHKTGFFCDQRENRARVAALARGLSVLDVCCYTGGFALSAWNGGAAEVTGVDLDESAVALAQRNANLNSADKLRFVHADAFSYLRTLDGNERKFGLVVLDPPKFIPNRRATEEGVAHYHDMNKLALRLVEPGGTLVTCSCSGLLPLHEFQDVVRRAARPLNRTVRLMRTTGAGPDHPVRLDFPEGAYLKALWLRVEG